MDFEEALQRRQQARDSLVNSQADREELERQAARAGRMDFEKLFASLRSYLGKKGVTPQRVVVGASDGLFRPKKMSPAGYVVRYQRSGLGNGLAVDLLLPEGSFWSAPSYAGSPPRVSNAYTPDEHGVLHSVGFDAFEFAVEWQHGDQQPRFVVRGSGYQDDETTLEEAFASIAEKIIRNHSRELSDWKRGHR
ncbi:hypothetical protein [Rhodococcus pyridinivorans]|uniref:Uncharacterized protein n=1 Tax=Rhodococcus pyridinivorans TaxID=103816 RepID=A0A7M2XXC9_9NOCA|nr:hypothetical protein [Rhodococcus pyridinivorans]QOW01682.1 hypothetical protein INP59_26370 [Rhodococcus pyridinivorans]